MASEDTKWMVALVDDAFSKSQKNRSSSYPIVKLKDPSIQQSRQYVLVNDRKDIMEVQSLSSDFSSFFVGRHIVKDGDLHVWNRVDPLFLVLAAQVPDDNQKCSWQPLDQCLGCLPSHEVIQPAVEPAQMGHLCQTMCNDQTDDVTYYKFSVPKALAWLQKKQERVFQSLLQQDQAKQQRQKSSNKNGTSMTGGSVSATFNMPDEDPIATPPSTASDDVVVLSNTKQLKLHSLQIVCGYLTQEWSKLYIESLDEADLTQDAVYNTTPQHKATTTIKSTAPSAVVQEETPKPTKKVESFRTMGNKRLAKVKTKGMQSMSSFFGPSTKKSKTTQ
jgi:hypothetical protein